jgi:hypothetical protein
VCGLVVEEERRVTLQNVVDSRDRAFVSSVCVPTLFFSLSAEAAHTQHIHTPGRLQGLAALRSTPHCVNLRIAQSFEATRMLLYKGFPASLLTTHGSMRICFSPRTRLNETYALERTNRGCSSASIKSTATSGADGRRRSSIVVGGGARRAAAAVASASAAATPFATSSANEPC